ncbi:tRNA threonylcarbamoyladenosine dehydratase [Anaerotignum neopropionicum]|uniref:tRNA threonylcarbamoyladenosine dehydratase n=1 Tax=Anaerotignum neopropionicum TaxID=36847 RepID=A0A136WB21_9FIRM|nr:tRNA threonylcarbamoyladenosine dehydratase [Anaerotignum neopropionicum]KXL51718.1 tRNA threonylcarbamoyladenosine dehydratase [Anaerotignum neopropionicum]
MQKKLHELSRAELLLGDEGLERLKNAKVAVFGIGGVGSFAVEALARGGVGHLTLIDGDCVSLTNINRQLIATQTTIGQLKTEVMKERIHEILPQTKVETYGEFFTDKNRSLIDFSAYDYIVDAIDMVTSKLILIEEAKKGNVPVISCMGTGNKLDPSKFEVADITKTSVCPLAKVIRKELKARGIGGVKVVYSKELPRKPAQSQESGKRQIPGSLSFVPPAAGMILAGEVICYLAGMERD